MSTINSVGHLIQGHTWEGPCVQAPPRWAVLEELTADSRPQLCPLTAQFLRTPVTVCARLTALQPDHIPVLVSHGWKVAVGSRDKEEWGEEAQCFAVCLGGSGARVSGAADRQHWGTLSLLPSLVVFLIPETCMPVGTQGVHDMEWVEARNATQYPAGPTKPHRK